MERERRGGEGRRTKTSKGNKCLMRGRGGVWWERSRRTAKKIARASRLVINVANKDL